MRNCAFTIVAKNYIGLAQILEQSIRLYSKDLNFYIIVADEVDDFIRRELPSNVIIAKETLDISPEIWEDMSFKYNLTEFCTSIKPASFRYIFQHKLYEKVIYLDPDIYFYGSIDQIFDMLENCDILLTPHVIGIPEFQQSDSPENIWLSCGIFNLGFCGISYGVIADKMLDWWNKRLLYGCYIDNYSAFYTDQKWMDFLPSFFTSQELHISRHLGMNVAPWNFFERQIVIGENKQLIVKPRSGEGEFYPLIFVHYSGYNYTELKKGNVVQNNISSLQSYPDIIRLTSLYAEAIKKNSIVFDRFIQQTYSYDIFENGAFINLFHRRLYRSLMERGEKINHPFSCIDGSFYKMLLAHGMIKENQSIDRVNKYNLKGVDNKLKIFNWMSRLFFKLIGYNRYLLFLRLMRPFSRMESQIHLLNKQYDSNNILGS